jgi:hypothetical protein
MVAQLTWSAQAPAKVITAGLRPARMDRLRNEYPVIAQ